MNAYEHLKAKLTLDQLALDTELIELPLLILEANEHTAKAMAARDASKNALDLTIADVAATLRGQPVSDGKGASKVRSEAQIDKEVPLYETVQVAQKDLEETKLALAQWQAMVDALRTKRDALKMFADLTIAGYLSPNAALDQRRSEIRSASSSRRRNQGG